MISHELLWFSYDFRMIFVWFPVLNPRICEKMGPLTSWLSPDLHPTLVFIENYSHRSAIIIEHLRSFQLCFFRIPFWSWEKVQKWFRRFVVFLFFNHILLYFWCLDYSQIANQWFLLDSNTLWMFFGTSKMFTKSGPLHPVLSPKYFKRKNMDASLKHIIFHISTFW